jgi:ATP-dependent exoDNAse (exonuclease V) beta subunit
MEKNFVTYRSSAGSGKTYTLVREFLRLCLSSDYPKSFRHILAITFTNKAADEMKEKVFSALKTLSEGENSGLGNELCELLNIEPSLLQQRASRTMAAMLHNYSELAIGTIDRFMHQLVRAFSRDLQLNHDFEVETDQMPVIEEAVSGLFESIGKDRLLTEVLVDFAEQKIDENKSWRVAHEIIRAGQDMLLSTAAPYVGKLSEYPTEKFSETKAFLTKEISAYENAIRNEAVHILTWADNHNLVASDFIGGSRGLIPHLIKVADEDVNKPFTNTLLKAIEKAILSGSKADAGTRNLIDSSSELMTSLLKIKSIQEDEGSKYLFYKEILSHLHELVLINSLQQRVEDVKNEKNLIFVDDFHTLISDVVTNEPAPFIYERIGQRFRHLMIDEFQDTSLLQWRNFLPLVTDALSSGGFVMLVGDGKQAIYRWRGGEVEQFDRLPSIYPPDDSILSRSREEVLKAHHTDKRLENNFRSLGQIVDFNNDLYSYLSTSLPEDLASIYHGAEQNAVKDQDSGLITLDFVDASQNSEASEKYNELLLKYIEECRISGYELKDICILTRNNNQGSAVARFLSESGLDVISESSLLIDNHPEVRLVIAAMCYLSEPGKTEYGLNLLIRLIRKYCPEQSHHELLDKYTGTNHKNEISEVLINAFLADQQKPALSERLLTLGLYEMVVKIGALLQTGNHSSPHWSFFKQNVLGFTRRSGNDLMAFLDWWKEVKEHKALNVSEQSNAIRIMSVHKSKGLQFPVVLMPYADWLIFRNNQTIWLNVPESISSDNQLLPPVMLGKTSKAMVETPVGPQIEAENDRTLLDNLNLLYVATTRPQERLYILSRASSDARRVSGWLNAYAEHKGYNTQETIRIGKTDRNNDGPHTAIQPSLSAPVQSHHDWRKKLKISFEAGELLEGQFTSNPRSLGTFTHRILGGIKTKEELAAKLHELEKSGATEPAAFLKITEMISHLLLNPAAAGWFEPHEQVLTEHPVFTITGETIRPDRVIIDGNNASVIDFKTGIYQPEHEQQIRNYGKQLREMGYETKMFLAYLELNEVMEISMNPQTELF